MITAEDILNMNFYKKEKFTQFFSSEKLIAADNIARALEWEFQKILTSKARRGLYSFFFEIQGFSTKISSTNSSNFT